MIGTATVNPKLSVKVKPNDNVPVSVLIAEGKKVLRAHPEAVAFAVSTEWGLQVYVGSVTMKSAPGWRAYVRDTLDGRALLGSSEAQDLNRVEVGDAPNGWEAAGVSAKVVSTGKHAPGDLAFQLSWSPARVAGPVAVVDVATIVTQALARSELSELTLLVTSPLGSTCEAFLEWDEEIQRYFGECAVVVGRAGAGRLDAPAPEAMWAGAGRKPPLRGSSSGSSGGAHTTVDFRTAPTWTHDANPGSDAIGPHTTTAWADSLAIADVWTRVEAAPAKATKPCQVPFAGPSATKHSVWWDDSGDVRREDCVLPVRNASVLKRSLRGKTVVFMGDSQLRTTFQAVMVQYCTTHQFPFHEYATRPERTKDCWNAGTGPGDEGGGCGSSGVGLEEKNGAAMWLSSLAPDKRKEREEYCASKTMEVTMCGGTFSRYGEGRLQGGVVFEKTDGTRFVYIVATTLFDLRFTAWGWIKELLGGSVDVLFFGNGLRDAYFDVTAKSWSDALETKLGKLLPLVRRGGSIQYVGPHANAGMKRGGYHREWAFAAGLTKNAAMVQRAAHLCALFAGSAAAKAAGVIVRPALDWWSLTLSQRASSNDGVHLTWPNPMESGANVFLHNSVVFIGEI